MLIGKIKLKNKAFTFDLEGVDNSTTLSMRISSKNYNAINFMDNAECVDNNNALWERRFDINMSKVVVETSLSVVNGKKVKSGVNADFFCKIGALIRYAKTNCLKKYEEGFTGLSLASGEFEMQVKTKYLIPFPCESDKILAEVTLLYDSIVELHIETDEVIIDLEEDTGIETTLFPAIKDGWRSGIAFNKDYLGFDMMPQTVLSVQSNRGMYTCIEDIIAAHPEKEFSWLLKKNYIIVTDENLEEICEYIMNWNGYVYYDTETTGLKINFKSRLGQADQLVGVVLSVKYGESFFFPTQMKSIPNLCGGDHWYFMEHYMRPILEGKELVAHNMSFDWKVAYIYDINANIVHDTMALIRLTIGAEELNYPMGLKENTKILLKRDSLELSDLIIDGSWGESDDIKFWDLPAELVRLYACADTDNTNGLLGYAMQADLLNKYNAKKVYEIEIAFSYAVAYQEFFGHRIDIQNLNKVREEIEKNQQRCMDEMVKIAGHEFNPNSPKDLMQILYHELGIPEQISRKTGKPTTDKETLKKLSEITDAEDNIKYPFCVLLQEYRENEGVRKIVDKFPEHVTEDGYIFSSVMQYGTNTGRVSINKPNYQSYNDPIKKNIIPRPGYWMFDTDYSSVEYRILGNMVGNKKIMENFKDPDFDYHAYQAAHMYGVPYSAVTKKLRKAAKGINFGLPYGMGDESLGVRVFGESSPENTRKAAALRTAYFKGQEDIRDWFEYHRNRGVNEGFTETFFGRRRYYHKSKFSENAIRRQAGNQVIQGCLSGETRIQTLEFGIVKLKDVAGLNVLVWDGEKWSNGDVLYSGKKTKCIVKFKGGQEIICSPQHKFLVVDNHGREHWVEAKDLKFGYKSSANNSHVRVNNKYEPSDHEYSSEDCYKYKTDNHMSRNVFLEDIPSSFDRGVVLGRLASDGSYCVRNDGGSYITQFVAEHEYNILPELRSCMTELSYTENDPEIREGRNEEVKRLSVYSSSLANEVSDLDIKHQVHDNIFKDTEMLRGFLSGFFDGDGGISGKAISLTFGVQYDFEPMCLDLQKALLFFGVRSRYRKYDDRHVIQIKTNDNPKFLDLIGFLNQDKQNKGRTLVCKEQETTFGKCIVVDSVEVTDELMDMYDVCNTDGGYYVADGIITHNTAADIYKTAVGRVFKRICKEGWLGKVLFTGFIHDELLGEVSNDINPAEFLKILREEFEVKVTNPDGSPWCPLYMGFGYGTSWYEAKSVELPIKLQWEIVEKYGETGFPNWDGDARKFCDGIPDMLHEFEVRDISSQMIEPEAQGKEIKPTLNNQILDCLKLDAKNYKQGISDYITSSGDYEMIQVENMEMSAYLDLVHDALCEYLDKNYHIQDLYKDSEGNYVDEFSPEKFDTQIAIDQFCMIHKQDRGSINLLNIEEVTESDINTDNVSYFYEDDEVDSEEKRQRIIDTRIDTLGLYLDIDNKMIILKMLPNQYMDLIKSKVNHTGNGYKIRFKDCDAGKLYDCNAWIESVDVNFIQQIYLTYFNALARR